MANILLFLSSTFILRLILFTAGDWSVVGGKGRVRPPLRPAGGGGAVGGGQVPLGAGGGVRPRTRLRPVETKAKLNKRPDSPDTV